MSGKRAGVYVFEDDYSNNPSSRPTGLILAWSAFLVALSDWKLSRAKRQVDDARSDAFAFTNEVQPSGEIAALTLL